jgi:hypothetical protein
LLAVFVMLFGIAYAWLARQRIIDRALVAFSALGKTSVFAVVLVFWILGDLPGRGVLAAVGDLVFAGIFVWWLAGSSAVSISPAQGG